MSGPCRRCETEIEWEPFRNKVYFTTVMDMFNRSPEAGASGPAPRGLLVLAALLLQALAVAVVPGLHLAADAGEIVASPITLEVERHDRTPAFAVAGAPGATGHHAPGHGPDEEVCLLCEILNQGAQPVSTIAIPGDAPLIAFDMRAPTARVVPAPATHDAPARAPPLA